MIQQSMYIFRKVPLLYILNVEDTIFEPTIMFIIFLDFSMFYQIFLSPQVKRGVIITFKHGLYELPHELLSDLENYETMKYQ